MTTELEHPGTEDADRIEVPLRAAEERELMFLMKKVENCKANMEKGRDTAHFPRLLLEHKMAQLEYGHRELEINLDRTRSQHALDLQFIDELQVRLNVVEKIFTENLDAAVRTALDEHQKKDDFERLVNAYKNGLKRGEERERKKVADKAE